MIKKTIEKIFIRLLRRRGYSKYGAKSLLSILKKDLFTNKNATLREKLWAYKRGFLAVQVTRHGITEENYKEYLSDFMYWKLFPINKEYVYWVDDKLTFRYILGPFCDYLPEYYYLVNKGGKIRALLDSKEENASPDSIINLLKEKKKLALKLAKGSQAEGFFKYEWTDNMLKINNKTVSYDEMTANILKLDGYIVIEYIEVHTEFQKIYKDSPTSIRLVVVKKDFCKSIIANAQLRMGNKKSGVVDDSGRGGITAFVDLETGRFYGGTTRKDGIVSECTLHPDTGVKVEGIIPYWEELKEKIIEVSEYLAPLKYFGYDVMVTESSFKIIEINSHQGLRCCQFEKPLLKGNLASDFFNEEIEKIK